MYMDNIKLFAINENELGRLLETKIMYIQFIMKTGKRQITEGIERLIQERIRMLGEKENYMYLEILKANSIKQEEMKGWLVGFYGISTLVCTKLTSFKLSYFLVQLCLFQEGQKIIYFDVLEQMG